MVRLPRVAVTAVAALAFTAAVAHAQGTITGTVRDTSGAVLPGVSVEAASPALIERVRSVVTDGNGQYRIVDLRPGAYTVTFTLPGFSTVKREGIELTGTFVATVNAELRVGALEETITVTGETPVVDVQSTTQQRVLTQEIVEAVPGNRVPAFMASLVPGITITTQDVGGTSGNPVAGAGMTTHGSRITDIRTMANGVSVQSLETGSSAQGVPNMLIYQEVTIDSSSSSAEQGLGGVQINLIPREGGNTVRGTNIVSFANEDMQGSNLSEDLVARGLRTPNSIKKNWDVNPAVGGPIRRDKIWFFFSGRYNGADNYVGGALRNANEGNASVWTYQADPSRRVVNTNTWKNAAARVTWQANPKHKLAFASDWSDGCQCPRDVSANLSWESVQHNHYKNDRDFRADWTAPLTNRLLVEGVGYHRTLPSLNPRPPDIPAQGLIAVTEQSIGLTYRAVADTASNKVNRNLAYRFAASYITGAHALKVGFSNGWGERDSNDLDLDAPINYRFNNGVPNQLTTKLSPVRVVSVMDADLAAYAQDRWTLGRLTMNLGVRLDAYKTHFPEQTVAPTPFTPNLSLTLPETSGLSWKDLTPRSGLAYDVFGTGKTAVKVSLNKYVAGQGLFGNNRTTIIFGNNLNPINRLVTSTTRSWNDANRNFVPDCDLTAPAANGECGAMANQNFGRTVPGTAYDPDILEGWGKRAYNWEFSTGIQQELLPRVSADVSFFRRWYGNFTTIDNRAVTPDDFTSFTVTAPADPRLPDGGGGTVTLVDLNPSKVGQVDNFVTAAGNYGKQTENRQGVDVTVNARPGSNMFLMGGVSTGRTAVNSCEVLAALPEMRLQNILPTLVLFNTGVLPMEHCDLESPFLTQLKMLGSYTIPKIDLQVSATIQSVPGVQLAANFNAPNALVQPSLGRPLSGGAANVTANLVEPGALYGDRINQVDLRFAKILRFGRTRTLLNLDLYNVLNSNPVLTENVTFGTAWRRPQTILPARFIKVGAQFDF
jgi:hypothetical protein